MIWIFDVSKYFHIIIIMLNKGGVVQGYFRYEKTIHKVELIINLAKRSFLAHLLSILSMKTIQSIKFAQLITLQELIRKFHVCINYHVTHKVYCDNSLERKFIDCDV